MTPPNTAPGTSPAPGPGAASRAFVKRLGITYPVICGAMYPCSNPELVAAASEAGGIGIVQPAALTYVHGHEFRSGLRQIKSLTSRPIGFNALIEQSSRYYYERIVRWLDIALEEGVRFVVTSLGKPRWVADRVHAEGGVVFHDVTDARWAAKAVDAGVDGLIAVNNRAGGHAGPQSPEQLVDSLAPFGLPVVGAGGVGDAAGFVAMLRLGYAAVQFGTRFIATTECRASDAYKRAILDADADDIVLTERLTGVPVAVINNEWVQRTGTRAGPLARWMLKGRKTKHWMRTIYALRSGVALKSGLMKESAREYWQAGKSVSAIHDIRPAGDIVREFGEAWRETLASRA
ncbi:MAG: nitronate monooxygenase [Gemmatimonadota bacterium]|nr:nitronate monooxygenase [Gemmatimonadota bacterium]